MKKYLNVFICVLLTLVALNVTGCGQQTGNQSTPAAAVKKSRPPKTQAQLDLTSNLYLVIDGSGSMQGSKMEGAKAAVREALSKVPDDLNIGLYVFDWNGASERVPLGPDAKQQVLEAVDAISADRGTPLGPSIAAGTAALKAQREKQHGYGTYRLIVVTDGEADDQYALKNAVAEAAASKISIYTIGVEMRSDHSLKADSVDYRSADNPAEVAKALTDFSTEGASFDPTVFEGQ